MPGVVTHFKALQLTIDRLAAGDAAQQSIAAMLQDPALAPYAHLGAAGLGFIDFLPSDPFPHGGTPPQNFATVWKMVLGLLPGSPGSPGIYTSLRDLRQMLSQIQAIVDAEDTSALCALKDTDFLDRMNQTATDFQTVAADLQPLALQIAGTIAATKPVVDTSDPTSAVPDASEWTPREFIAWKATGKFLKALFDRANETGDQRLLAYAYGYLVSYSTQVAGAPFVNSIVGGPFRTQWWRQRFVANFIDAWVHGAYAVGAVMSDDMPSPGYDSWPDICGTNMQKKIELQAMDVDSLLDLVKRNRAFPAVLPQDFADTWFAAFEAANGHGAAAGRFDASSLNAAYTMLWLMLWFKTSGAVFGCKTPPPMTPPGDCGDRPGTLDPFQPAPDGGPTLPPEPSIDYDTDVGAVICGIILAIFGVVEILSGNIAAGAAAIAGAVDELDCDSTVDFNWDSLRCELFWYHLYIFNALKGVHQLMVYAGLDYPYASALAIDSDVLQILGNQINFDSGKATTKSRVDREGYPSKPWDGSLLTFNSRPLASDAERPSTIAYRVAVYPSFFLDDDVNNPLSNGDVKTAGHEFPFRSTTPASTGQKLPVQFGNAVANAVDLIAHLPDLPPSWNLDADRGLAWLTWQFHDDKYDPSDVKVDPES